VLSQEKYAADLLERAGMKNYKSLATPLSTSEKLSLHEGDQLGETDSMRYRCILGALQYLTLTRLALAYAINKAC
jgi:hypothetical protein